jgi:hypothetical protein
MRIDCVLSLKHCWQHLKTFAGINFAVKRGEVLLKNLFCFELHEAEKLRDTYSSWIGKEAHVGKGIKEKLHEIKVKPRRSNVKAPNKFYHVEFVFDNKTFSAQEFLFHNGLQNSYHPFIRAEKQTKLSL